MLVRPRRHLCEINAEESAQVAVGLLQEPSDHCLAGDQGRERRVLLDLGLRANEFVDLLVGQRLPAAP
jgi:hypothetical protein